MANESEGAAPTETESTVTVIGPAGRSLSDAKITHVISDLDGTLIDTESAVTEVARILVERYGKTWTGEGAEDRIGKWPIDGARATVQRYGLPCTPEELLEQSHVLVEERWSQAKPLPGAHRLMQHLQACGIPMAVASSSPRRNVNIKLSFHAGWTEMLQVLVGGDEVEHGKPRPDIFLRAAELMGASPAHCLVVEDAPAGVEAAIAAGMWVLAVPSLPNKAARPLYSAAHQLLPSLLDFQAQHWGLPPFSDWLHRSLPITPWYIKGPVIKGFGRGSKVLGIPTANLPASSFTGHLAEHVCGIYHGWAGLKGRGVFKMVMSVGWNPFFNNTHKTVEPWLLHDFGEDFYDEELRLVVVGYIRPEADFPSLPSLIARIHEDGDIARAAIESLPFASFKEDPFLTEG
ncbi:unnamed protein product [Closterium sp. Naga37s-1]|nr:unnamed protein product [Closterium sp. Naga37s-1]